MAAGAAGRYLFGAADLVKAVGLAAASDLGGGWRASLAFKIALFSRSGRVGGQTIRGRGLPCLYGLLFACVLPPVKSVGGSAVGREELRRRLIFAAVVLFVSLSGFAGLKCICEGFAVVPK